MYLVISKDKWTTTTLEGNMKEIKNDKVEIKCHGVFQTETEALLSFLDDPESHKYEVINITNTESFPVTIWVDGQ